MRRLSPALALLAALASTASAQVRSAAGAAAAEAGGLSAAASSAGRPSSPLGYQTALLGSAPSLNAASAFFADAGAQAWLRQNRPELLPALLERAYALRDWRQALTALDEPRALREAILSRPADRLRMSPAAVLEFVDADPALADRRRNYEVAVLDWSVITKELRSYLRRDRVGPKLWSGFSLAQRYAAIRKAAKLRFKEAVTARVGSEAYAGQYEAALARLSPVLTDDEIKEHDLELARAVEASAGLKRAREALRRGASESGLAVEPAAADAPSLGMEPSEVRELSDALHAAMLREIAGAPLGDELLAFFRRDPATLTIGKLASLRGEYSARDRRITISEKNFVAAAAILGYDPRSVKDDPRALRRLAKAFSDVFVHEGTHHRQYAWSRKRLGPEMYGYADSQQWEIEAFSAQTAYMRGKLAADPEYAEVAATLSAAAPEFDSNFAGPAMLMEDPKSFWQATLLGYSRMPTLARRSAELLAAGRKYDKKGAALVRAIDRELAYRRRAPKTAARIEDGSLRGRAKSELLRMKDGMSGQASAMTDFIDRLYRRSRAETRRLARALIEAAG